MLILFGKPDTDAKGPLAQPEGVHGANDDALVQQGFGNFSCVPWRSDQNEIGLTGDHVQAQFRQFAFLQIQRRTPKVENTFQVQQNLKTRK